jgi:transposase
MLNSTTVAGIDTSKAKLDAAVHGNSDTWQVENTPKGWKCLASYFAKAGVTRAGIEASGGYERGVVAYLRKQGVSVILLQPLQVKAFAKLHLRRAKNDSLDAILIAACTAAIGERDRQHDPRLDDLADNLTVVEQIEQDLARIKNRLEFIKCPRFRRYAESDRRRLKARRAAELRRIEAQLRTHDDLAKKFDLLLSIPGIAERTAIALIVRMPELGTLSREKAAALAGLAPFDNDSGDHKGERRIAGGRCRLRKSLFAAALPAASRWNPALVQLYRRLTAAGKAHNEALIACARKLLIYANTVLHRGTPWVQHQVRAIS